MLRNLLKTSTTSKTQNNNILNSNHLDNNKLKTVDELHRHSRGGLWGILFYLAASIVAYHFRDQSLASVLPADIMQKLGAVPPVFMAAATLWISTFSSLSIISGRLFHSTTPSNTITHVAFRIGLFALFFMVGGLSQYINELFVSGLIVVALQHYNVSSYYTNAIEAEFGNCSALKNSL